MKNNLFFIFVLPAMIFVACKHETTEPAKSCSLPVEVSFTRDIIPVFNRHCSTSGCHSGNTPEGNLSLEAAVAYHNLMKPGSGYIDTIHPNYSLLYAQMISVSTPMPPTGNLDTCTTNLILKWIEQKAKNN